MLTISAMFAVIATAQSVSVIATVSCPVNTTFIEGFDLIGHDILTNGHPTPIPVTSPAACCVLCATKRADAVLNHLPLNLTCNAYSFNHGSKTCWMKWSGSGRSPVGKSTDSSAILFNDTDIF